MSNKVKLDCPHCRIEYISEKRNQIYCSSVCRERSREYDKFKSQTIEMNNRKQYQRRNSNFIYHLESNTTFIKSFIPDEIVDDVVKKVNDGVDIQLIKEMIRDAKLKMPFYT
jgi:hypothetical protein